MQEARETVGPIMRSFLWALSVAALLLAGLAPARGGEAEWWDRQCDRRIPLEVANATGRAHAGYPFWTSLESLKAIGQVNWAAVRLVSAAGREYPCQVDDMNRNGKIDPDDEIAALLDVRKGKSTYYLYLSRDPDRDANELLDDFFPGYYGTAAGPMRKCFDLIESETCANQSSAEVMVEHRNGIRFKPVNYPPRVWRQCLEWAAEAERLARDDPWALRHVRIAKMSYLYADVARDAQRAEEYADEPGHPFWKYVAARRAENAGKLLEAVRLSMALNLKATRGNAEPATPEAMLAMWAPNLGIAIEPFRRVIASGGAPAPAPKRGKWTLVFQDDFERAELGEDWRVADGNFRIEDGHVVGRGYGLFIEREFAGDQRLEYDAWVDPGQTACDLDALLSVTAPKKWRGGDGYLFQFGGWGNTVNAVLKEKTRVYKGSAPNIQPGKRHHIVCEKAGRRLRWRIDGKLVADYEDPFDPLPGKRLGFLIDTVGNIDNVKVYTR